MADWERLKSLFAEAIELSEVDRTPFIERSCGDDTQLRKKLEDLVRAHDDDDDPEILEPAEAAFRTISASMLPVEGRRIGKYRIERELGRGGMGTVYLAERIDGEFEQKVALKLIRQTFVDPETEKRFRRERDILASLSHPYIAGLLDGGVTEAGEPYFAMEYVEGVPLLDQTDGLATAAKLRVFIKVCSAVAYAHRNLTVHRDIKPSNILVTSVGDPKLLDFGLGKLIGDGADPDQTATALRAFTPAYASPEQILGKPVTTLTDVYSLGVVLYEMLSGAKPHQLEGLSLEEMVRTLTMRQPIRPSLAAAGHNTTIDPDLDNIVLKCLQPEPDGRFTSVDELSEDICRYLDGKPVSARPNTFRYRTGKFIKRNKAAVGATAAVAIALLAGTGISMWQANVARAERDRAERRFREVRQLSNALLFQISPAIERVSGSTEARELVVRNALKYLDSLNAEAGDDEELRAELAIAYQKVGDVQGDTDGPNLSDFTGALTSYRTADSLLASLPQDTARKLARAAVLRKTAKAEYTLFRTDESVASLRSAIDIYADLSDTPEADKEMLEARVELARVFASNSDFKNAVVEAETVVRAIEGDQSAAHPAALNAAARAYYAFALSWESRQTEAEEQMDRSISIAETVAKGSPADPALQQLLWDVYFRASAIYETIDDARSLALAEKGLAAVRTSINADANNIQAKQNLARAYHRIGIANGRLKRTDSAIESFRNEEQVLRSLVERAPRNLNYKGDLATMYFSVGTSLRIAGDTQGSIEAFRNAIAIHEEILVFETDRSKSDRHIGMAAMNLADLYGELGETTASREWLERSRTLLEDLAAQGKLSKWDEAALTKVRDAIARR